MASIVSMLFSLLTLLMYYILFRPIYNPKSVFSSNIKIVNLIISNNQLFLKIKIAFLILCFFVSYIIFKKLFSLIKAPIYKESQSKVFSLLIGYTMSQDEIRLDERSLYQNMLITGSIGCGKTSSAMYPFTKQLMNMNPKPGFLILDVKGNYYSQVLSFANECSRSDDVIIIELGRNV